MSTSPTQNPVTGVVTFTARGTAALDQLAEDLVAECDGSPASIAELFERVLKADIEELTETLSEAARPDPDLPDRDIDEVEPTAGSPDEAARRRLEARTPGAAGARTRSLDVGR